MGALIVSDIDPGSIVFDPHLAGLYRLIILGYLRCFYAWQANSRAKLGEEIVAEAHRGLSKFHIIARRLTQGVFRMLRL